MGKLNDILKKNIKKFKVSKVFKVSKIFKIILKIKILYYMMENLEQNLMKKPGNYLERLKKVQMNIITGKK